MGGLKRETCTVMNVKIAFLLLSTLMLTRAAADSEGYNMLNLDNTLKDAGAPAPAPTPAVCYNHGATATCIAGYCTGAVGNLAGCNFANACSCSTSSNPRSLCNTLTAAASPHHTIQGSCTSESTTQCPNPDARRRRRRLAHLGRHLGQTTTSESLEDLQAEETAARKSSEADDLIALVAASQDSDPKQESESEAKAGSWNCW